MNSKKTGMAVDLMHLIGQNGHPDQSDVYDQEALTTRLTASVTPARVFHIHQLKNPVLNRSICCLPTKNTHAGSRLDQTQAAVDQCLNPDVSQRMSKMPCLLG